MIANIGILLSLLLVATLIANSSALQCNPEPVVACYLGTWAAYRQGLGTYNISNINPFACTELLYAFFGISASGEIRILDANLDLDRGFIAEFNGLKKINPSLKTIASIGGWNEGSTNFAIVANNESLRLNFAKSTADFCIKHGFDGVNMDWEYPMDRNDLGFNDRDNFNLLLKAMKEAFDPLGLQLSAAVRSTKTNALKTYNIPEMILELDHIHIMAYDMTVGSEPFANFNAPLYAGDNQIGIDRELNVEAILQFWTSLVPASKLTLGTPMYGHTFILANASNTKPGAASAGPGPKGPITDEAGTISYNELCLDWQSEGWTFVFDEQQGVPYALKDNLWVSYDNPKSILLKGEMACKYGLSGLMTWSLESDDFHGLCGEGKSPLLHALNQAVGREIPTPEQSLTTESTTEISEDEDSTTIKETTTTLQPEKLYTELTPEEATTVESSTATTQKVVETTSTTNNATTENVTSTTIAPSANDSTNEISEIDESTTVEETTTTLAPKTRKIRTTAKTSRASTKNAVKTTKKVTTTTAQPTTTEEATTEEATTEEASADEPTTEESQDEDSTTLEPIDEETTTTVKSKTRKVRTTAKTSPATTKKAVKTTATTKKATSKKTTTKKTTTKKATTTKKPVSRRTTKKTTTKATTAADDDENDDDNSGSEDDDDSDDNDSHDDSNSDCDSSDSDSSDSDSSDSDEHKYKKNKKHSKSKNQ